MNPHTVFSAGLLKGFGIEVSKPKAQKILDKEKEGYVCYIFGGITIEGKLKGSPKGTPTGYFIPESVKSKSGGKAVVKKNILGQYIQGVQTPIVCIRYPSDIITVMLDTVAQWNTPK